MKPKVSIIIPVYNGEDFLSQAIHSSLSQTYPNIEILVIDDGSTDSTWQIIQSYGERIIGIHKPNGGVSSALNYGINEAKGEYIAWLSHDDVFFPQKVERQITFLEENPAYFFCYANYAVMDKDGKLLYEIKSPVYPPNEVIKNLFISSYINGCTTLIHRVCFEKVGLFNEALPHTQDTDMWIRMSQQYQLGHIAENLLYSRKHENQGSLNYKVQFACEREFYAYELKTLGIEKILAGKRLPEKNHVRKAYGYQWLGDQALRKRLWNKYAAEQYSISLKIWHSWGNPSWIKLLWAKMLWIVDGDEMENQPILLNASTMIDYGKYKEAGDLVRQVLVKNPLNRMALFFWIFTRLNKQVIYYVKQLISKKIFPIDQHAI